MKRRTCPPFSGIIAGGVLSEGVGAGEDFPIGVMLDWPNSTAPTGWLIADGSTYNRADYPDLWAILDPSNGGIGGVGDGSTTFTMPDFRGRISIGKATSGTAGTMGTAFGTLGHRHNLDLPNTESGTTDAMFSQEVDAVPVLGTVFCPNMSHTHFTNVVSFSVVLNNPPCRVVHRIMRAE